MKTLCKIFFLISAFFISSCSGSREFRLDAVTDDIGTQNVSLIYYSGGSYHIKSIPAIDGQFSLSGSLSAPTFVEVYTNSGALLGECIIDGGDVIKARFSKLNPENIKIEGNKDAEQLAEFLKENHQLIDSIDTAGLNQAIESFIKKDPKRFVATVLLSRYFTVQGYEQTALELIQLIPNKYRKDQFSLGFEQLLNRSIESDSITINQFRAFSHKDTVTSFSPTGTKINLLMLTDNDTRSADSIKEMLSVLRAGDPKVDSLRIVDLGCDRDTMLWHSSLRSLPEDYPDNITRLWLNAGMATEEVALTAPTTIPFFILTDSTGRLLYRGQSTIATRAAYGQIAKKH